VFIEAKDDGSGDDNWATGAISLAKLQSNHHHRQTNIQLLYTNVYQNYYLFNLYIAAVGEEPLQVARCTKIINAGQDDARYMINVKQFARFVVDLGDQVAPSDIEEGMRVGSVCTAVCCCPIVSLPNSSVGCLVQW